MGLFKNVKNMFFEEELEEKNVEINDNKIKEAVTERDLFQTEPTFKFPVIFENDELEEKEEVKKEEKPIKREEKIISKIEEPKKEFKVSPVISPVYGILEKNYKKEEVKTRDGLLENEEKSFDLDSVRKRAFGEKVTREEKFSYKKDDEEIDLTKKEVIEDKVEENKELDLFEEKQIKELDDKIKTIDELLKESNDDFYSLVDSMYEGDDE